MTILRICRGLPGSGKTTHALEWLSDDREHRARVNRDDLRAMLHDSVYLGAVTEDVVKDAEYMLVHLVLGRGLSVIVDDTNLDPAVISDFRELVLMRNALRTFGKPEPQVTVEIADFTDVPLEECIRRNAGRAVRKSVPEQAIRDMHARWLAGAESGSFAG